MGSLADEIKQKAFAIGFQKVGIVPATPLEAEESKFREWLDRGFHAEMAWMEREPGKRTDPKLLYPEAKSVIVTAINYFTPHRHDPNANKGKISRYAWGDDYHDIIREKLTELLEWIKLADPRADGKICIDTAPMMDKVWAVRGGLGWIGKHSNVITTDVGSWVFIGSVILNIELDYDVDRVEDHCGTCTACLDACPTNAIVAPYVVDSRRCISYATIELRDEQLPGDIEANLNGWIYGCDICQEVCPWNRFEKPTHETRFEPRHGETSLDLDSVLSWSPDEYAQRFRRSAVKRAKLPGLRRNAAAIKDHR